MQDEKRFTKKQDFSAEIVELFAESDLSRLSNYNYKKARILK